MYDSWVYSVYNFALGLPIIFYGIFDRDIPAEFALKYPMVCRFLISSLLSLITLLPFPSGVPHWSHEPTFKSANGQDLDPECDHLCHHLLLNLVQCRPQELRGL
jgi:hypothetical protein